MFLNLWKPVAIGAGNTALRAEANRSLEGTQLQSHFLISLEFSLVENYNTRFIKKIQQLNSDMQSYRSKDFSLKQVSGLMGGPDPPDPPPGSATALVPFDILSTAFGINSNTPITICYKTFFRARSRNYCIERLFCLIFIIAVRYGIVVRETQRK